MMLDLDLNSRYFKNNLSTAYIFVYLFIYLISFSHVEKLNEFKSFNELRAQACKELAEQLN